MPAKNIKITGKKGIFYFLKKTAYQKLVAMVISKSMNTNEPHQNFFQINFRKSAQVSEHLLKYLKC